MSMRRASVPLWRTGEAEAPLKPKLAPQLFLFLALLSASRLLALDRFEAMEPHMGSMVRIVLYARDTSQAKRAFTAAFVRVAELDSILSDYKPDSELNRLCASGDARVSLDLYRVLDASQHLSAESDGAFDITLGPLTRLWREARKSRVLPDPGSVLALTGFTKLALEPATRRVTLTVPGMRLDVGGIAKGFVADEALLVLTRHGIASAMVAASGDIAVSHPPPGRRGWDVTVELLGGTRELVLHDAAVSTAGDTEQFLELGGVRYSHILDPRTGMALTRRIAVSVVAPAGLEADGLDTAIAVLGPERGVALMRRHPKAWALIVTEAGAIETGRRP